MDFPLILSGPILRRVEPTLISVQVVLRETCRVRLSLFEGLVTDDSSSRLFNKPSVAQSEEQQTLRVGDKLHLTVVMLKLPDPRALLASRLYSYNITLTSNRDGQQHDLKSLGLLQDRADNGTNVKGQLSLGYAPNRLPGFSLPPAALTDLRIAHGSCRRINHELEDGQAWVDDMIAATVADPDRRLHQLLLTGDQIYADDVAQPLLPQLLLRGAQLLGVDEFLPTRWPENATGTHVAWHPADRQHFPPAMRHQLIESEARFTTVDAAQHLISFGEFAAMYLFIWCNELWDLQALADFDDLFTEFIDQREADGVTPPVLPANWGAIFKKRMFRLTDEDDGIVRTNVRDEIEIEDVHLEKFLRFMFITLPRAELRRALKAHDANDPTDVLGDGTPRRPVDPAVLDHNKLNALPEGDWAVFPKLYAFVQTLTEEELVRFRQFIRQLQSAFGGQFKTVKSTRKKQVQQFYASLPKVRRALANVPTYMMFDDHEVTDDWNLNPLWRDRVLTAPLGRTIVRNGMLAYALFQGWGNDPEKFRQGKHQQLLTLAAQLFATSTHEAQQAIGDQLDPLFGLNQRDMANNDDQLSWHYTVRGPKHLLLALDNRTRRTFVSRYGPPGNMGDKALAQQIPAGPLPAGLEVVIVICSLPVFAPSSFDELIAPLSYRMFDTISYMKHRDSVLKGMPGTAPDAIEGWPNAPVSQEALLKRLEPYRRVVLLSGDVHYSASVEVSYWKKGDTQPARFVQLISSGLRNIMPSYIHLADRHFARAQSLTRSTLGNERLGWNTAAADLLTLPAGAPVVPVLKARLRQSPVLLPTTGWPAGTTIHTAADWAWRARVMADTRPDNDRPEAARPDVLNAGNTDLRADDFLAGYRQILQRHASQLSKMSHGRQVLFANGLGLIRFALSNVPGNPGQFLKVQHQLFTVFAGAQPPSDPRRAELYTLHEAVLAGVQGATINEPPPVIQSNGGAPS